MESTSPPTFHSQQHNGKKAVTPKLLPIESSESNDNIEQDVLDTTCKDTPIPNKAISENTNIQQKSQHEAIEELETARITAAQKSTLNDTPPETTETLRL